MAMRTVGIGHQDFEQLIQSNLRLCLSGGKKYGDKYRPAFLVDNDENKWGRSRMGIPIRKPEEILEVPEENRRLIICSYYYREISEQLDKLGVHDYKVYVQEMEWILRTEEQYEG